MPISASITELPLDVTDPRYVRELAEHVGFPCGFAVDAGTTHPW